MEFQGTVLAQEQERKLVKSLRRADVLLFIVAAVIALDTIGTIASGGMADGRSLVAALALGAELRREMQFFRPSALNVSDNILGDSASDGFEPTSHGRNVFGVFGEVDAPLTKQWELQFAARYDHYDKVGSTVNPKFGVRFQPSKELLFRGSVGTGFRAPSLTDLYRPMVVGATAILPDPVCMANTGNDLATCADSFDTHRYSNPDLKPEKSRQFSLGAVFEPNQNLSVSLDYWNIKKTDLISEIGDDVILANLDKYGGLVHRYSDVTTDPNVAADCEYDPTDNSICYIELRKEGHLDEIEVNAELKPAEDPSQREACAAVLLQGGVKPRFACVGLPDEDTVPGAQADIFRHYGISMEGLAATALRLRLRRHRLMDEVEHLRGRAEAQGGIGDLQHEAALGRVDEEILVALAHQGLEAARKPIVAKEEGGRLGRAESEQAHLAVELARHGRVQHRDRAREFRRFRNDVRGRARMNRSDGHDPRQRRIQSTRDDRLERHDERSRPDDRVGGFLRARAVRAAALTAPESLRNRLWLAPCWRGWT